MAQVWHDLLFAHWELPAEALRPLLPAPLELDLFEGRAYLGVVPFRMSGVRLRGTPSLPWLSAFPELNVRTYVTLDGRPGVWFLSLDAGNPLAVAIARAWFRLPYYRARMSCEGAGGAVRYASVRTHRGEPPAGLACTYAPRGPAFRAREGTLEHFLTERYWLYAPGLLRAEIQHPPWELQEATAAFGANTMARAHGLELPDADPLLHFARRQDMVTWAPRPVLTAAGVP